MADISGLQNLQSGDPLDWDGYTDAKEVAPPPRKGRYVVQAPQSFTFGATKQGYLSAQVDPIIVAPASPQASVDASGYQIRFSRVSAKPFKRGETTVSQLGDYLRATGSTARPLTPQEQADAVEQTAGRSFQVDLDWEAYDQDGPFNLKGMENFPLDAAGNPVPWVQHPSAKDDKGEPKMVRANVRVQRFVAMQA